MIQQRKIALPRYAEYNCAMKYVVEQGFESKCILPPPLTRRTEELGAKNSPDFVCTPFKTTLGSMIEALEAGADTILMVYGICRLNYYGELQEQILRDLGYRFDFINLCIIRTVVLIPRTVIRGFISGFSPTCMPRQVFRILSGLIIPPAAPSAGSS